MRSHLQPEPHEPRLGHFDYHVHTTMSDEAWSHHLPPAWTDRPEAVMDMMVDTLCDLVRTLPIAIVAHPTMLPPALLALEEDIAAWWTGEREDRFIEAAVGADVAIEISNRYRLPHRRLLGKALEATARFSLGSDGHTFEQVARLGWAVDATRAAGIGDAELIHLQRSTNSATA